MVQPIEIYEEHFLTFPYTTVIMGFSKQMIMTVEFGVRALESGQNKISVTSLIAVSCNGENYDMEYLLDDDSEEGYAAIIVTGILGNQSAWDIDGEWWNEGGVVK